MRSTIKIIVLIGLFYSCKNESKHVNEVISEKKDYIESNKIKYYSQNELLEILKSNRLDNKIEINSTLEITDTIKIKNARTGALTSCNLFYKEPLYCFIKDTDLYFILNNYFYNYNSDSYYIKINSNNVIIAMDSSNLRNGCFESGYTSTVKKHKLYLNKKEYNLGDTLKCRALFLNYGKFNDCTKDINQYFLDSMDVKFVVHAYDSKIHQELLSKFPK